MYHPTDRITHTTAFFTPAVEHWLIDVNVGVDVSNSIRDVHCGIVQERTTIVFTLMILFKCTIKKNIYIVFEIVWQN